MPTIPAKPPNEIAIELECSPQNISLYLTRGVRVLWRNQVRPNKKFPNHFANAAFWKALKQVCREEGEDYDTVVKGLLENGDN